MRRSVTTLIVAASLVAVAGIAPRCARPALAAAANDAGRGSASGADPLAGGDAGGTVATSRGPLLVVLRIAELLHLSDEQTIKVASAFRRIALQRRELLAQKAALASKLEGLLAQKPLDDAALGSTTAQLVGVEHDLTQLPESLWKAIQPVLTPEQGARLILLRGRMKQQLEGERQRRRQQHDRADGAR